jgi:N-acetylmuramoyl-L-alanine amidase
MFRTEVQAAINGKSYISASTGETPIDTEALKLQKTLNALKMRDGKGNYLEEDGIIGGCTREAVKRFQNVCGLAVDGIAGCQTWGAIDDILIRPILKVGSIGTVVRYLQYRVGAEYDGIFGWETNRCVAVWQGQNGCTQDGIVGPQTWKKMIG